MVNDHIGTIVKNLDALHDLEYKVTFSLHENTFFQKLVSKEVLERVRVKPADYFKSLLFLEYFTNVIENKNYSICDNLLNLSKVLREEEKQKNKDEGENGPSYLNLETVVFEAGMFSKEMIQKSGKKEITKSNLAEIKKRYDQEKPLDLSSKNLRKIEPFYEAVGEMVSNQVSDKTKKYLLGVKSRNDLSALIFADSVTICLENKTLAKQVYDTLAKKDYYSASLIALKNLIKESSIDKLKIAIKKNAN